MVILVRTKNGNFVEVKNSIDSYSSDNFLTIKEVARKLNITTITLYRYIKNGKIKAKKLGDNTSKWLISKSDFKEFLSKL